MTTMKEQLREALVRLRSSAKDQEAYLRQLGTAPSADELALEFSDALGVLEGQLDEPAFAAASRLDRYLEDMSGSEHAELWTINALHAAPEWAHVRELAEEALRLLEKGSE
jgi:hypothetical protein